MRYLFEVILILSCALIMALPVFGQGKDAIIDIICPIAEDPSFTLEGINPITYYNQGQNAKKNTSFLDFINSKAYAEVISPEEERKILRKKWKKMLGSDIFYAYYKAKEVEDWFEDKGSVNLFNKIKGKPTFYNKSVEYKFKLIF